MPTLAIKTVGGQQVGEVHASERVFGARVNIPLMHQAVKAEMENRRQDTKNAPGRGEMLGGGRKPFKQKGTGRARQGSIVAPHWRKGGAAHGPHPRDLGHALPRKMKRLSIWSALTAKLNDAELIVVEQFPMESISTKTAAAFVHGVTGGARKSLVIVEANDDIIYKSLRNVKGITLRVAPGFSTRDVIDGGIIVATKAAIAKIDSIWASEEVEVA